MDGHSHEPPWPTLARSGAGGGQQTEAPPALPQPGRGAAGSPQTLGCLVQQTGEDQIYRDRTKRP